MPNNLPPSNLSVDINEFHQVTASKALEKLLETIRLSVDYFIGQTSDGQQFKFRIRSVTEDIILASSVTPVVRPLLGGEAIELLFGCVDGAYLVRTVVRVGKPDEVSFQLGTEVFRMQRRNNFRVAILAGAKVVYRMQTFRNAIVPPNTAVPLADLSSGGMRLKWPLAGFDQPKEGDHLGGILTLPNGKTIELFGIVKMLLPQTDGTLHVGLEFQNASLRDEQALLFAVVHLQREFAARF